MIDPIDATMKIAASGLNAQSQRLRVVSENIANANSTGETAGADPYRRKTIAFDSVLDRTISASLVEVRKIGSDTSPFRVEYDPGNPAADENGNVKLPNVNMLIEMADMRETNRSYEANLKMMTQARTLAMRTIDLLRTSS